MPIPSLEQSEPDERLWPELAALTVQIEDIREIVLQISDQLKASSPPKTKPLEESAFRFAAPRSALASEPSNDVDQTARQTRPPLPDPRLLRRIIRQRQLRARFLDGNLFADPAWDMLLDLAAARAEHKRVSVTSLCIAASVPPTTALRWIGILTKAGLVHRIDDDADKRRAFIALSDEGADAIAHYFAEMGAAARFMA